MNDQGKILCFFNESGEIFNYKLAYAFEEYLKESNEKEFSEKVEKWENID